MVVFAVGGRYDGGMDDKGSFFTRALAVLGFPPYVAGSEPSAACEELAPVALGRAFEFSGWSFALRCVTLETDAEGFVPLPPDCLRLCECSLPAYRVFGRRIRSEVKGAGQCVELVYVTDAFVQRVELPQQQPLFNEACVLLLAGLIAPRVTDNVKLGFELRAEAERKLALARLKDAQQFNMQEAGYVEQFMRKGVCRG